jgi:2-dehydropantoate 2-reductase
MRILVVGAGATGGYFGGRLAQAGRDVTFLVRDKRAAQLRTSGLQIISPHGDFTLAPKLVTANKLNQPFDAVLLTVKAYALEAALKDIAPAVGPDTMILPVLNGMKQVDAIKARFGSQALAGGICKIASRLDLQGRIVQMNQLQYLAYGEMNGDVTDRIRRLDKDMHGAGFDARLSPDIEREMWEKWLLLASLGAITCLARGNIGQVAAAPGGFEFAAGIFDEVASVISAVGRKPTETYLTETKAMMTQKGSPQTSSMYRDLQNGYPVEAEQIIGDLLDRARRAKIAAPLLSAAFVNLSVYQNGLAAK